MKQLALVGLLTLTGTLGTFVISPFCGIAVYYIFAVLRPQAIWQWSLPPDIQWSRFVALASIAAALGAKFGLLSAGPSSGDAPPKPRVAPGCCSCSSSSG